MSLYPEGAILTLKKSHPCGSREWQVLRAGWEYRLQCVGCRHVMLMRRDQLHKLVVADHQRVAPQTATSGTGCHRPEAASPGAGTQSPS